MEILVIDGHDVLIDGGFEQVGLLAQFNWKIASGYAICTYRERPGVRRTISMHRMIVGDVPKGRVVDHINRNKLDNRRANLRVITQSENCKNLSPESHARKRGKHPPGLSLNCGKWQVVTRQGGRITWHGTFDSQTEAIEVAQRVAPWLYTPDKMIA